MSISIGLDFGSLGYRAAYVLEEEIISVPMPPDETTWRGLIFVDPDPNALPLGLTFSSLKYQLGTGRRFSWRGGAQLPEDAVQDMFTNIKRVVETYAGEEIDRAVIAVPAQYPALRRSIVRELGEAAGFEEVDLINDCTAVALGHTYGQEERALTLLLYSMGFIGFEVSLVRYARQHLRELVHEGTRVPSGREFDVQTMVAALEVLRQNEVHLPTKVFTSHWFDFRLLASDLKERLTVEEEAILNLPPYITGTETKSIRFRRDDFEHAIARQVETTLDAVQRALEDTGMGSEDVDQVVLVGGSTRIGVIQRQLEELFGDKLVQPRDDLIARGAAVQAHRLAEQTAAKEEDVPHYQPPAVIEGIETAVIETEDEHAPVTLPPAVIEGIETAVVETEDEHAPVILPPEPDVESLFAYARQLAEIGQNEAAADFLEELERRSQALQEELSRE